MCRHLGWLGQSRSAAELILEPPHSLLRQSYAPRRQRHGLLNADGWGVGLWVAGRGRRWRGGNPLWQDDSFAEMAPILRSTCMLAAVRSATPQMPIGPSATAPFRADNWLISHNGVVSRTALAQVRTETGTPSRQQPESQCDSALLVALIFDRGLALLPDTLLRLARCDPRARMNLLLVDGQRLIATTWGDTLFQIITPWGIAIASEPYDDDPHWQEIDDGQLIQLSRNGSGPVSYHRKPLQQPPGDFLGTLIGETSHA